MTNPYVVLDTGVLISYRLKKQSTIAEAVDAALDHCKILLSQATFDELRRVLERFVVKKRITRRQMAELLSVIEGVAEWVPIVTHIELCRDPKDDKFLSLAVNGAAEYIVTGDEDLLVLKKIGRTKIVSPKDFITLIKK